MAQNRNERDLRYKNGKTYDYTEIHNNKFGGRNNKRPKLISSGKNNKRNTPHYEPNKLFNVLAGGALLAVLTIGGFNTLANIVKGGIDAKNNIEDAKDTISDIKEAVSGKGTNSSSYKVKNLIDFDIDEETVQKCIENVYETFNSNDVYIAVNEVIIIDYEDANTEEKYKKNVFKKVAGKESTVTVLLISTDRLTNENAIEQYNECKDIIMNNTDLTDTAFINVLVNGVTNIPTNGNIATAITYCCSE